MSYRFSGVIAPAGDAICAEAMTAQFGGRWRAFAKPFAGFAIAFAADHDSFEAPPAFEMALLAMSRQFPGRSFIRIEADCFGGTCGQSGYAFRDGVKIAEAKDQSKSPSALEQLAEACGAVMPSAIFPAFDRGYFTAAGAADAAHDRTMMAVALTLAAEGVGKTAENPVVGCVIAARRDGVFGAARTADGGRPHAEEQALEEAGERAKGATAYVTLEPCAQRSAGGVACTDLLISAGVARVVIAVTDPHPLAAGKGLERLRVAGVVVEFGLMHAQARAQNLAFFAQWDKRA